VGGHDKNELEKANSAPTPNQRISKERVHVIDFGERINSSGLTTVCPLIGPVGNILRQRGED